MAPAKIPRLKALADHATTDEKSRKAFFAEMRKADPEIVDRIR